MNTGISTIKTPASRPNGIRELAEITLLAASHAEHDGVHRVLVHVGAATTYGTTAVVAALAMSPAAAREFAARILAAAGDLP